MEIIIRNIDKISWLDWTGKVAPVIIGFCSIVVTILFIYVTYRLHSDAKKQKRREATARYFEIFTSDEFHAKRGLAWAAMEKFYLEDNYRNSIYEYPTDASKIFSYTTNPKIKQKEISAVWRMIEFLSLIESSEADVEILIQCGFYYDWWRIFLLDFCDFVEDQYDKGFNKFFNEQIGVYAEQEMRRVKIGLFRKVWVIKIGPFRNEEIKEFIDKNPSVAKELKVKLGKQLNVSSPIAQFRKLDEKLIKKSAFDKPDPNLHIIYHHLTEEALKTNGLKLDYEQKKMKLSKQFKKILKELSTK